MGDRRNKKESLNCRNCPAWSKSAFKDLSDFELNTLAEQKTEYNYSRGEPFSQKGEPANEVYCLRSGSSKVTMIDEEKDEKSIVKLVAPGDMLGYRCIFSEDSYRGTASALNDSVACQMDKSVVMQLIERSPNFAKEMLKRMGEEVASAEAHHHSFCKKTARERVGEALLILKEKFGVSTDKGWMLNTKLTRNELSNWIGVTRETIIRNLSDFTNGGVITQESGVIYINDCEALMKISGISPRSD